MFARISHDVLKKKKACKVFHSKCAHQIYANHLITEGSEESTILLCSANKKATRRLGVFSCGFLLSSLAFTDPKGTAATTKLTNYFLTTARNLKRISKGLTISDIKLN